MQKKILLFTVILFIIFSLLITFLFINRNTAKHSSIEIHESIGVGVSAEQYNEEAIKYEMFIEYLNDNTNDSWHLVPVKNYSSFINYIKSGYVKISFMESAIGYKLIEENIAIPVVREQINGNSTYDAVIIVRKNSDINDISGLINKKFAFVNPYTSAGYLFPIHLLKTNGYDTEKFFKVSTFLYSDEKIIYAVLNGKYDGGAIKNISLEKLSNQNQSIKEDLLVIESAGLFPLNALLASTELDPQQINDLRQLLLNMHNDEKGKEYLLNFNIDKYIITEKTDFALIKTITTF